MASLVPRYRGLFPSVSDWFDGVLEVTVPVEERKASKPIEIEVGKD